MHQFLLAALAFPAALLAWKLLTLHTKRHRSPEEILAWMDAGNPHNLIRRMSEDFPGWRLSRESDAEFWTYIGRYRGLARIWRNARGCGEICRSLGMADAEDISFAYQRSLTISALAFLSLPEAAIRCFAPALPHLCAMLMASLYVELRLRTENLCTQHNPALAQSLAAII